jgi:hypothetical protein
MHVYGGVYADLGGWGRQWEACKRLGAAWPLCCTTAISSKPRAPSLRRPPPKPPRPPPPPDVEALRPLEPLLAAAAASATAGSAPGGAAGGAAAGGPAVAALLGPDLGFEHNLPQAFLASGPGQPLWLEILRTIAAAAADSGDGSGQQAGAEELTGPIMFKAVVARRLGLAVAGARGGALGAVRAAAQAPVAPSFWRLPEPGGGTAGSISSGSGSNTSGSGGAAPLVVLPPGVIFPYSWRLARAEFGDATPRSAATARLHAACSAWSNPTFDRARCKALAAGPEAFTITYCACGRRQRGGRGWSASSLGLRSPSPTRRPTPPACSPQGRTPGRRAGCLGMSIAPPARPPPSSLLPLPRCWRSRWRGAAARPRCRGRRAAGVARGQAPRPDAAPAAAVCGAAFWLLVTRRSLKTGGQGRLFGAFVTGENGPRAAGVGGECTPGPRGAITSRGAHTRGGVKTCGAARCPRRRAGLTLGAAPAPHQGGGRAAARARVLLWLTPARSRPGRTPRRGAGCRRSAAASGCRSWSWCRSRTAGSPRTPPPS